MRNPFTLSLIVGCVLATLPTTASLAESVYIHVEQILVNPPSNAHQQKIDQIRTRLLEETDESKKTSLTSQLTQAQNQATRESSRTVNGVARFEREPNQAAVTMVIPSRYRTVIEKLDTSVCIQLEDPKLNQDGPAARTLEIGKSIRIVPRPNDFLPDPRVSRPWEEPDSQLTERAQLVVQQVEFVGYYPPRVQRVNTALGSFAAGGSPGGTKYNVRLRNDSQETIRVGRTWIVLLDAADQPLKTMKDAVVQNLKPGGQRVLEVFIVGERVEGAQGARIDVVHLE